MVSIPKLNFGHVGTFVLCNQFYFNSYCNYKLLYILGILFLLKLKLNALIALLVFIPLQIILINNNSVNVTDDLIYFVLSLFQFLGMIGWINIIIRYKSFKIDPFLVCLFVFLSISLPNSILNIDILLASIFAFLGYRKRSGFYIDWFNFIISIIIGWRAATVAVLAGVVHKFLKLLSKTSRIFLLLGILIFLSAVGIFYSHIKNEDFEILGNTLNAADPSSGRLAMWWHATIFWLESVKDFNIHSFVGHGFNFPANMFFEAKYITYHVDFFIFDFETSKNVFNKSRLHLHNFIYQNLIEFGLFGLLYQVYIIMKLYSHGGKIALLTTVGMTAGFFSSVFYVYSSFFVLIYILYVNERNGRIKL